MAAPGSLTAVWWVCQRGGVRAQTGAGVGARWLAGDEVYGDHVSRGSGEDEISGTLGSVAERGDAADDIADAFDYPAVADVVCGSGARCSL